MRERIEGERKSVATIQKEKTLKDQEEEKVEREITSRAKILTSDTLSNRKPPVKFSLFHFVLLTSKKVETPLCFIDSWFFVCLLCRRPACDSSEFLSHNSLSF